MKIKDTTWYLRVEEVHTYVHLGQKVELTAWLNTKLPTEEDRTSMRSIIPKSYGLAYPNFPYSGGSLEIQALFPGFIDQITHTMTLRSVIKRFRKEGVVFNYDGTSKLPTVDALEAYLTELVDVYRKRMAR